MRTYILRRFLYTIPILFGVSVIMFSLIHLSPGSPIDALLPPDASVEDRAKMAHELGFDKPIPVQYVRWLLRAVQGDLGKSTARRRPVTEEIGTGLRNTFLLALAAGVVGFSLGILLGSVAAFSHGHWVDKVASAFAIVGVSLPNYWAGILLIIFFSVQWRFLPPMGMSSTPGHFGVLDVLKHMILPTIALSMIPMGITTRMVRASVLEILSQEFVVALRAKGLYFREVVRHVLKNASLPVLTVMGLQFGSLVGGSVLVETVFSWPGEGYLLNLAIAQRDIPVIQGGILALASFFVFLNLIVDITQSVIDPRIRRA